MMKHNVQTGWLAIAGMLALAGALLGSTGAIATQNGSPGGTCPGDQPFPLPKNCTCPPLSHYTPLAQGKFECLMWKVDKSHSTSLPVGNTAVAHPVDDGTP